MIAGSRLDLQPLTAPEAARSLSAAGLDGPVFAEGYPSEFATRVLRLVALHPSLDDDSDEASDLGPWLVLRRTDRAVIGAVTCARGEDASVLTVGYDIAPPCRGQGYATEALSAVVEHLLGLPEVRRVHAETTEGHTASRRVMEKAGLRWQRHEVVRDVGREVSLVHYAIDRPAPL
ncbi:MAG TPA: GNAT family N-acetyltransferase [Pseudonocardia sp.]